MNKIKLPAWTGVIWVTWALGGLVATIVGAFYLSVLVIDYCVPNGCDELLCALLYVLAGSVLIPASLELLKRCITWLGNLFELEDDPDDWDDC